MYGADLKILDAEQNMQTELKLADRLIKEKVDVLVVTPVEIKGAEPIPALTHKAGIPVVTESVPTRGADTHVAICDYDAGYKLGKWAGEHVKRNMNARASVLDVNVPWLRPSLMRGEGFVDGLKTVVPNTRLVARVDGKAVVEESEKVSFQILEKERDVNVIFGMDDESAIGGIQAYRKAGLDENKLLALGFGFSGNQPKELIMRGSPFKAAAAMFPEYVGVRCIDLAVRLYAKESVKPHEVTPSFPISGETLQTYYHRVNGEWIPDLMAISEIPVEANCTKV